MELKCCTESRLLKSVCSNRTFMELKFRSQGKVNVTKKSSNRTFMELKFRSQGKVNVTKKSSNRTFMELKSLNQDLRQNARTVLIAPLWN